MSFMDGPDCGPINPLQSLLKHSERDASVQHDRFVPLHPGSSSSSGNASIRTGFAGGADAQHAGNAEMQRFYEGRTGNGDAFAMDAMQRELAAFRHNQHSAQGSGRATPVNGDWARQFSSSPGPQQYGGSSEQSHQADAWRQAYLSTPPVQPVQQQVASGPSMASSSLQQQQQPPMYSQMGAMPPFYQQTHAFGAGSGMMGSAYQPYAPMNQYQPQAFQRAPAASATSTKGKERFVELDDNAWEAQFAKLSEATKEAEARQADEAQENEQAAVEDDEETDAEFLQNLDRTWKNLKDTLDTSQLDEQELAAWEAQYGTNFADLHGGEYDFYGAGGYASDPAKYDEWLQASVDKPFPYTEEQENPFIDTFDPFAEGQRLLREGHPLSEAALAFEAACKQNEHRGEAWRALGDTLAADEKELKAIKALERAVSCPDGGGEGAWMSLAISYVNEGQDIRSLATLEKWISSAYPDIVAKVNATVDPVANPWAISERVIQMFLSAARAGPAARAKNGTHEVVDADVQSGLGVLFYTNSDYTRAKDCFEAALSARPDDFLLWNRLGATLANGGQPEEAIDAYRKALELRPTFTRAIYNLGVSCLNINCFHEAAEHLLAALDLHRKDQLVGKGKGKGPGTDEVYEGDDGSDNLWNTLRRAFLCMDRPDLAERAMPGADIDRFKSDGFDF